MSNNRIQSLPPSIGRLEDLKILLADVNALTRLPPTIGKCRSIRILNVASNNLLCLPEEIGQLRELRVLNLANNYLRHLPCSMAQLPNLTALWLNDNQKKPLVALQTEHDERSDNQILTCFLFPQTGPIFGPVSPAVAAAVLAAASRVGPAADQRATQLAAGGPQSKGQLQMGVGSMSQQHPLPPPLGVAHRHFGSSGNFLDEDEDCGAPGLLQTSNTLPDQSSFQGDTSAGSRHPSQSSNRLNGAQPRQQLEASIRADLRH